MKSVNSGGEPSLPRAQLLVGQARLAAEEGVVLAVERPKVGVLQLIARQRKRDAVECPRRIIEYVGPEDPRELRDVGGAPDFLHDALDGRVRHLTRIEERPPRLVGEAGRTPVAKESAHRRAVTLEVKGGRETGVADRGGIAQARQFEVRATGCDGVRGQAGMRVLGQVAGLAGHPARGGQPFILEDRLAELCHVGH